MKIEGTPVEDENLLKINIDVLTIQDCQNGITEQDKIENIKDANEKREMKKKKYKDKIKEEIAARKKIKLDKNTKKHKKRNSKRLE